MNALDMQYQPLIKHTCRRCKADFQDRSRLSKFCPACRGPRKLETNAKCHANQQKRRQLGKAEA